MCLHKIRGLGPLFFMGVDDWPPSAGEASGRKKNAQFGDDTRATAHKHNHEKHSGDARRGQRAPIANRL